MRRDKDFGAWLLEHGLLQRDGLRRAMEVHDSTTARLDTVLLDLGLIAEAPLLEALGRFHNTRTVSRVELRTIGPSLARTLPARMAVRLRVAPFRLEGRTLAVAMLDPSDLLVEDELSLVTGYMVTAYVTLEVRLIEALSRLYDLLLPGHSQALISRLEQGGPRPRPGVREVRRETAAPRKEVESAQHVPHALRRRRPQHAEPLDLSQEDLSLFPSLRAQAGEGPPGLETGADLSGYRPPDADLGPEDRLAATARALQNAEMREDIADAVLGHCAPLFRRRMMLVVRSNQILGWRGEGDGVRSHDVRGITIPADEPSVFLGLLQGADFWLGPLPEMEHNTRLVAGLGGAAPSECLILPVRMRDRTVCLLYFDNLEHGVGGLPMAELKRLAAKVSLAFQVYLMKSKIRNV